VVSRVGPSEEKVGKGCVKVSQEEKQSGYRLPDWQMKEAVLLHMRSPEVQPQSRSR
jgi:hypothetical protein